MGRRLSLLNFETLCFLSFCGSFSFSAAFISGQLCFFVELYDELSAFRVAAAHQQLFMCIQNLVTVMNIYIYIYLCIHAYLYMYVHIYMYIYIYTSNHAKYIYISQHIQYLYIIDIYIYSYIYTYLFITYIKTLLHTLY